MECRVGTLNLLGDCSNPVEFLPQDVRQFMHSYQQIERTALSLTIAPVAEIADAVRRTAGAPALPPEVENALDALDAHCSQNGDLVWAYFSDDTLRNDNKILGQRLNLLTLAMASLDEALLRGQPSATENAQQWQIVQIEQGSTAKVISAFGTLARADAYSRDGNLFVWDVACCVVAMQCREQFLELCSASLFNPENANKTAAGFFGSIFSPQPGQGEEPVLLALQEWPAVGSHRRAVFNDELDRRGCQVLAGPHSVAVASRGFSRQEDITASLQAVALAQQISSVSAAVGVRGGPSVSCRSNRACVQQDRICGGRRRL